MKRVLIALSSGVDSSTAAWLLKEQGYELEAAFMVFKGIPRETIQYAKDLAEKLNIKFHTFDFTDAFEKKIVANFIAEYKRGRTPNPCVLCNEIMKFGLFLDKAKELDFDKVATGHYARLYEKDGRYLIKKGLDRNEQSYFLYRLHQKQLANTIFPLGAYTKKQVRAKAVKAGLPTAKRKKSQDICFISKKNVTHYLSKNINAQPGLICDMSGNILGKHEGIIFYTIGQRRGIGLSDKLPYYVTRIDAVNNIVYVGKHHDVYKSRLVAARVNFLPFDRLDRPVSVLAKTRYVADLGKAIVKPLDHGRVEVDFERPQWAIAPGQSVVFYDSDTLVGGGLIDRIFE